MHNVRLGAAGINTTSTIAVVRAATIITNVERDRERERRPFNSITVVLIQPRGARPGNYHSE